MGRYICVIGVGWRVAGGDDVMSSDKIVHIKSKKLCLANGDEFTDTEFAVSQDILDKFITVKAGTKTIKVNPDFILSFEENQQGLHPI